MVGRPLFDDWCGPLPLIDRMIGEQYDIVKLVADNLPFLTDTLDAINFTAVQTATETARDLTLTYRDAAAASATDAAASATDALSAKLAAETAAAGVSSDADAAAASAAGAAASATTAQAKATAAANSAAAAASSLADLEETIDGLLPLSGGIMTGALELAGDPATNLEAATKHYVDLKSPRKVLFADGLVYVRASGNDSTADGSGAYPFLTLTAALRHVQLHWDLNGYVMTLDVGAGTFDTGILVGNITGAADGSRSLVVRGAGIDQTFIHGTTTVTGLGGVPGTPCFSASAGAKYHVKDMTIGGAGDHGLWANQYSVLSFENVKFLAVAVSHLYCSNGTITIFGNYTIAGPAASHMIAWGHGKIGHYASGTVVTVSGTPAFSNSFASAYAGGLIVTGGTAGVSYTGSATGQRYACDTFGMIDTNASGASYFPGSVAGVASALGVYA